MSNAGLGEEVDSSDSELFERLASATPAERVEIVLALLESSPEGRLVLPTQDDEPAMLDNVDLSRGSLESRISAANPPPIWWNAELRGIRLNGAFLKGVGLRKASLQGADLSESDLRGAHLGGADLSGATLERADLGRADLAGTNLEGASLGQANLHGAMLEEANLKDGVLRFVKLLGAVLEDADLRNADLWGAEIRDSVLTNADLRDAVLEESDCEGADLSGANLQGAVLRKANLKLARLEGADLRGAIVGGTNFRDAVLKDAWLQEVDLSHCDITHVHMSGARLDGARFQHSQLGGAIGEELAGQYDDARKGYLALERAFVELGDPDAASWAYRRRRRMQKKTVLEEARSAGSQQRWREASGAYARYVGDQFVEWLCDYGESITRVLASLLVLYVFFAILYGVTGSVAREEEGPNGATRVLTTHPVDLALFSLLAMTAGGLGIRLLPRHDLAMALVGIHLFIGIAMTGLLGFVLGNRIRR